MIKRAKFVRAIKCLGIIGLVLCLGRAAWAVSTATQAVAYSVAAINEISVSGDPGTLSVTGATAGSEPAAVTNNATSYSITTNKISKKITGQITTGGDMPTGLTLEIELVATGVGTAGGKQTLLSTLAKDLVTAISNVVATGKTITYTLTPTVAAGEVSGSRTVTLTVSS